MGLARRDRGARRRRCGTSATTSNDELARNPHAPFGFRRRAGICGVAASRQGPALPASQCLSSAGAALGTRRMLLLGQAPRLGPSRLMASSSSSDLYSPREIALAAGVSEADVRARMTREGYLRHDAAVALGRSLVAQIRQAATREPSALFASVSAHGSSPQSRRVIAQLAMSSTVHAVVAFVVLLATFNLAPRAAGVKPGPVPIEPMRLVFLATHGRGGGGGGGGWQQPAPAPQAMREGREPISSPLPKRREPPPIVAHIDPKPAPPPPLASEQLPAVVAPIVAAPANARSRVGVVEESRADASSHG